MHKTVTITIGGSLFHVEETAYDRLDSYLRSVRSHFASYPDSEEIVQDIESRIAEDFFAALGARKKVVTEKDVEALIRKMGTVEDFEAFEGDGVSKKERHAQHGETAQQAEDRQHPPRQWGRLYRDPEDQMLGGVCAGIGKWLGIDPTIVRLLFAATVLAGGTGVVLYILLWAIVPEAKTTSEKVEMTQGRVTLGAIQRKIEEKLPKERRDGMLRKIIDLPFAVLRALGRLLRAVFPVLGRILGGIIAVGGAFGIAAITLAAIFLTTNLGAIDVELPLTEIIGHAMLIVMLAAAYFTLLFPLIIVIILGSCLLAMRNTFNPGGTIALFVLWLVSLTALAGCVIAVAPAVKENADRYQAEINAQETLQLPLKDFTSVTAGDDTELAIARGPWAVTLTGPESDVRAARAEIAEGTLTLKRDTSLRRNCLFLCHGGRLRLEVTMPELRGATAMDAARADIKGFTGGTLTLTGMMGARVTADVSPSALAVRGSEAARFDLRGKTGTMSLTLTHGSRVDAEDMAAQTVLVDMSMGSRATVNAAQSLTGDARHGARLEYAGDPSVFDVRADDSADVERNGGFDGE